MWPQPIFISPSGAKAEVVCFGIDTVSFTAAGGVAVPTPNCAQPGDFQVLVFSFTENAIPLWDQAGIGPNEGDWLVVSLQNEDVFDATYASGLPTTNTAILMRRIVPGFTDFAIPISGGGAFNMRYVTYILRGLDTTYYPLSAFTMSGYSGGKQGFPALWGNVRGPNPQPSKLYGFKNDLVVNHEHLIYNTGSDVQAIMPTGPTVLFADGHVDPLGFTPNSPTSIVQKFPAPWVDLLADKTWDDWIRVNTVDQAAVPPHWPYTVYSVGTTALRKGLRLPNIPLIAGQSYRFAVRLQVMSSVSGSASNCLFMTIVDPQNVEHGVGSNETNTIGVRGTLMDQSALSIIAEGPHAEYSLFFTPVETGNYELRLSMSRQDQLVAGDLDACTLSTTNGFRLNGFALVLDDLDRHSAYPVAKHRNPSWTYWDWEPRRLLGRRATGASPYSSNNSMTSLWATLATSPARPVTEMSANWAQDMISGVAPDRQSVIATPERSGDIGTNELFTWQSSTCVYPQIADAFYFEINITTGGTGRWGVFFAAPTFDASSLDGLSGSDWYNHFIYDAAGSALHWTTSVGSLAPLTTGDVLGVAIRFDTMQVEFYVNGTLQVAFDMEADYTHRYCIWRAFGDLYANGTRTALYSTNFTGPWAYPAVPGAAPFDWANSNLVYHGNVKQYSYLLTLSTEPTILEYPAGTAEGDLIVFNIWGNQQTAITVSVDRPDYVTLFQPDNTTGSGGIGVYQSQWYAAYAWFAGTEKSVAINTTITGSRSYQLINYRNVSRTTPLGYIRPSGAGANIETIHTHFPSQLVGAPINPSPSPGFILGDWPVTNPARNHRIAVTIEQEAGSIFFDLRDGVLVQHYGGRPRGFATEYSANADFGIFEYLPKNRTLTNLFDKTDQGFNDAAWTKINTNTIADQIVGGLTRTNHGYSGAIGTYQSFTQTINLEAGKRYTLVAEVGGSLYPALLVDDGTNGPRGYIWPNNAGSGQYAVGGIGYDTMPQTWNAYNTAAVMTGATTNKSMGMGFTAEVTGPHTFHISRGFDRYAYEATNAYNSTSGCIIDRVALVEGFAFRGIFCQWPTFAGLAGPYSIEVGDATVMSSPANITLAQRVNFIEYELMADGVTPADTRWMLPNNQNAIYNIDETGLETVGPTLLGSSSGSDLVVMASTGVPPAAFAGPDQFQFEVEILALTQTEFALGVTVHQPAIEALSTVDAFDLQRKHMWAYRSLGTATANGGTAITGLDTTTTPGDIITVAVHRSAGTVTFYKNGTQLVQLTGVDAYDYPLMAALSIGGTGSTTATTNRFRANFKGPFSYPVSGFSPYQWW